jgi:hypothetical protein
MKMLRLLTIGLLIAGAMPQLGYGAAEPVQNVDKNQVQDQVLTILTNEPLLDTHIKQAFELIEKLKVSYGSTEASLLQMLFEAIMNMPQLSEKTEEIAWAIIFRFRDKLDDPNVKLRRAEYEKLFDTFQVNLITKVSEREAAVASKQKGKEPLSPVQSMTFGQGFPVGIAPKAESIGQVITVPAPKSVRPTVPSEQSEQQSLLEGKYGKLYTQLLDLQDNAGIAKDASRHFDVDHVTEFIDAGFNAVEEAKLLMNDPKKIKEADTMIDNWLDGVQKYLDYIALLSKEVSPRSSTESVASTGEQNIEEELYEQEAASETLSPRSEESGERALNYSEKPIVEQSQKEQAQHESTERFSGSPEELSEAESFEKQSGEEDQLPHITKAYLIEEINKIGADWSKLSHPQKPIFVSVRLFPLGREINRLEETDEEAIDACYQRLQVAKQELEAMQKGKKELPTLKAAHKEWDAKMEKLAEQFKKPESNK